MEYTAWAGACKESSGGTKKGRRVPVGRKPERTVDAVGMGKHGRVWYVMIYTNKLLILWQKTWS